ncbi:hypothetical protein D3C77_233640 [compost metagenome]
MPEMLTTLDLYDGLGRQFQGAFDMRQREGISFGTDLDDQAAHHRKCQWHFQMKTTALPAGLGQHDGTA